MWLWELFHNKNVLPGQEFPLCNNSQGTGLQKTLFMERWPTYHTLPRLVRTFSPCNTWILVCFPALCVQCNNAPAFLTDIEDILWVHVNYRRHRRSHAETKSQITNRHFQIVRDHTEVASNHLHWFLSKHQRTFSCTGRVVLATSISLISGWKTWSDNKKVSK